MHVVRAQIPARHDILQKSGGTLVIRPDSGDPQTVLRKMLGIMETLLGSQVTRNAKGFKMLPPYLRIIQGDGIDRESMREILYHICHDLGWSASNIAFGSGGGLLQKLNRDTQKFAFKCCSVVVDGIERDVRKDPITDSGKRSKTKSEVLLASRPMNTVYANGPLEYSPSFDECRARMSLPSICDPV